MDTINYSKIKYRLSPNSLNSEMLIKAARIKNKSFPLTAIDATAGMGIDALILAAFGFSVTLYEHNSTVANILRQSLKNALNDPFLAPIINRMTLIEDDSIDALSSLTSPVDLIYLDPMFPEKKKSSLSKKKLQFLQDLESPCKNEEALFQAALSANPSKIIVKRPIKSGYLANVTPNHSISGKLIRYDCYIN